MELPAKIPYSFVKKSFVWIYLVQNPGMKKPSQIRPRVNQKNI